MQDMGWRVVQVETCGIIDVVIQDIGSGEDNGQDEEVKSLACHAKLYKGLILEVVDDVLEEFIWKVGERWHVG
jgi:hypothetical protein